MAISGGQKPSRQKKSYKKRGSIILSIKKPGCPAGGTVPDIKAVVYFNLQMIYNNMCDIFRYIP
jgi:hypothetical protein